MSRLGVAVLTLLVCASSAFAERPRTIVIDQEVEVGELTKDGLVPYNTLFLNRCASGCAIKVGTPSSITDSWPIGSNRTLTAFPYDDATWQQVVSCVKDVFEPFNVQVTDVDPGTANHFEIMIAGSPADVGMAANIGGVASASGSSCSSYANNALVFDFAKVWGSGTTCGASCVEDICSTAAQEIGHTWNRLDHTIDNKDPMTYFSYAGRKYFQNTAAQCGSDCVNGISPTNQTCTGTGMQSHNCICGGATQNSYNVVGALFGFGPGSPPTVSIISPKFGASVDPGFSVAINATDNSGTIASVELRIDNQLVAMSDRGPFVFNTPATLGNGTHHIEATAYDPHQTPGKATIDVVIGPPCKSSSDCTTAGDVCVGGRCVPGSGVDGGLGTTCTGNLDCKSGLCAADDQSHHYCVEQCMVGDCPDNFGCLDTGNMQGVCWPGYDDGTGGGCGCQSDRGGPTGMLVLFGWLVISCRRRRARS